MSRLILIPIFLSTILIPTILSATPLSPPSLTTVMQTNEALTKQSLQQQKKKKQIIKKVGASLKNLDETILYESRSIRVTSRYGGSVIRQDILLDQGARIESYQTIDHSDSGEPFFQREYLGNIGKKTSTAFSLINGQFFDPKRKYTPLSFGLKVGSQSPLTYGYDDQGEQKNLLIISSGSARIVPYSHEALDRYEGSLLLVSLTTDERRRDTESIGRTFICLPHTRSGEVSTRLLVFSSLSSRSDEVEYELRQHHCLPETTAKLDGGGSTQLWMNPTLFPQFDRARWSYRRAVPHAIVIYER